VSIARRRHQHESNPSAFGLDCTLKPIRYSAPQGLCNISPVLQRRAQHVGRTLIPALLMLLLVGCSGIDPNATPISIFPTKIPAGTKLPTFVALDSPSATPNAGMQPTTPAVRPTVTFRFINPTAGPTTIPTLDANWSVLSNGVQYRRLGFRSSTGNDISVLVVRIDPRAADIKVRYEPSRARMIQDWRLALPGAVVIVNASFYAPPSVPVGLVAVDGTLFGSSIPRQDGGMFQIKNGAFKVRSLYLEPYNNTERFDQVVQGFPMLMVGGQVAPAFDPDLSSVTARRTVIAQDTQGRILFLVTPFSSVTLPDLAQWLGVSGLNIDSAVNMDGGGSTCMYLATGGPSQFTQGLSPVPVVLAVYPR